MDSSVRRIPQPTSLEKDGLNDDQRSYVADAGQVISSEEKVKHMLDIIGLTFSNVALFISNWKGDNSQIILKKFDLPRES